MKEMNITETS